MFANGRAFRPVAAYARRVITRIRFAKAELVRRGIKTPELYDLDQLVVLAGPNGGGKTRHLDLVQIAVNQYDQLRLWAKRSPKDARDSVTPEDEEWFRENYHEIDSTMGDEQAPNVAYIRYEPQTTPANPDDISQQIFDKNLAAISEGTYGAVAAGLHVYLEAAARALWNGTHSEIVSYPNIKAEYEAAYNFNLLIDQLLGTTVEAEPIGNSRIVPRLVGKRFQQGELSVGQRVLLCWAILLMGQSGHYKDKIVLLDEPEVYLHPDVCVRALDSLRAALGEHGQIWIATHSLPLIAWAWGQTDSLYFVENGKADHAISKPSRVWKSLLGGEATRDALLSFLDGDAAAAATRFAADCLLPPGVASTRPNDPQPQQLVSVVANRLRRGQAVRVLEVGAGSGRLVAEIVEMLRKDRGLRPEFLTYTAYEDKRFLKPEHQASCERHLATLRSLNAQASYSNDLADVQAREADHVDITVLANTLHEIPIESWFELFEQIRNVSKPEATLLVIEDQEPRIGELPHPRGFLILEKNEWRALVNAEVEEQVYERDGRRLTAFQISVKSLGNASPDRLARALDLVAKRAIKGIQMLRGQAIEESGTSRDQSKEAHKIGRRHAFFAMLHLNATLALDIYGARRVKE